MTHNQDGRMSVADAKRLGLLEKSSLFSRGPRSTSAATRGGKGRRSSESGLDPQLMLTDALRRAFPQERIEVEAAGLVAGRKYRVDIFLPEHALVIEVDGFAYHSSKSAFQEDRKRQNAIVAAGYRVLRYYNGQIRNEIDAVIEEIAACIRQKEGFHA